MREQNEQFGTSGFGFVLATEATARDRASRRSLDHGTVERLLRRVMRQHRGSAALRRLLDRAHFRPVNIHLLTDEQVVRSLRRLVSVGEIHVTPAKWWHRGHAGIDREMDETKARGATGGKPVEPIPEPASERRERRPRPAGDPADRPFPPASRPPEPKNWIEFHLVDHETDEPIANVPFRLSLPDGAVAEHTSDGSGMIRIDDLPPGYCDIQAILDKGALEVVGIA